VGTRHPQGSGKNSVTIVFDSREYIGLSWGALPPGIAVVFSDGRSADEAIVALVEKLGDAPNTVVVIDDRGLRRHVASLGAHHRSVSEFLGRGAPAEQNGTPPADDGADSPDSVTRELEQRWLKKKE
jgi:hypothetical protein